MRQVLSDLSPEDVSSYWHVASLVSFLALVRIFSDCYSRLDVVLTGCLGSQSINLFPRLLSLLSFQKGVFAPVCVLLAAP